MSKLIITTVGTSVIGNELYPIEFKNYIGELRDGNSLKNEIILEIINQTAERMVEDLNNNRPNEYLSAEIASLRAFKGSKELGFKPKDQKDLGCKLEDQIVLLSSDTEDGLLCAKVNKVVLEKVSWCKVSEPVVIKGLKTKSKEDEDISNLFKDAGLIKLKEEVEQVLKPGYINRYFNITGGFKGAIPFITILAFEKRMSLIYLYEESSDLIVIEPPRAFKCSYVEFIRGIRIRRQQAR